MAGLTSSIQRLSNIPSTSPGTKSGVGSKQLRTVTRDGDRLILTTPQYRFANDGKMSVNVLVWEKIK